MTNDNKKTLKIDGMSCGHCKATVEKALLGVEGVEHVTVDLDGKVAEVSGNGLNEGALEHAVTEEGFRISK